MSAPRIRLGHLYADLDSSMLRLRQQHEAVSQSREIVEEALLDGEAHYGINTGFGVLANKRISSDDLATLQREAVEASMSGTVSAANNNGPGCTITLLFPIA